nr:reverse transcriptase domain-containing protein [Tanacetum cinerariifolium]
AAEAAQDNMKGWVEWDEDEEEEDPEEDPKIEEEEEDPKEDPKMEKEDEEIESEIEEAAPMSPPPIPADHEPEVEAATIGTSRLVPLTGRGLFTNTQVIVGSSSFAVGCHDPKDLAPSHIRNDLYAPNHRIRKDDVLAENNRLRKMLDCSENCIRTTRREFDRATRHYHHLRDLYVAARDVATVPAIDDDDQLLVRRLHHPSHKDLFLGGNNSNNRTNNRDNTHHHQQNNQRQRNARMMTTTLARKGGYAGNKLFCNHCKKHHFGYCKRNNQQGEEAQGQTYVIKDAKKDHRPNVVTGTLQLNNRYAIVLFDSRSDKIFVNISFSHLIDINPVRLDTSYEVELADGRVASTNTVLSGCTLNLLNHMFKIDLMPIELGTFDVVIGMDCLAKQNAVIVCGKKCFHELALLCREMVPTKRKKIYDYIRGLTNNIKGTTILSRLASTNKAVRMAHALMEQKAHARTERITELNKRKWESSQGGNNSNNRNNNRDNTRHHHQNNQRQRNARMMTTTLARKGGYAGNKLFCNHCKKHHFGYCKVVCRNYGRTGHMPRDCKGKAMATGANTQPILTCYECGEKGHTRNHYL